jgi:hypothetical protein
MSAPVINVLADLGKVYAISHGPITGTTWLPTPYQLTIAAPPSTGVQAVATATYVPLVPAVDAVPASEGVPEVLAAPEVPASFQISIINAGSGYLVVPAVSIIAAGLSCSFTPSVLLLTALDEISMGSASPTINGFLTTAETDAKESEDAKLTAITKKDAAETKRNEAASKAADSDAAQIAKLVAAAKTARDAAGIAAGVAYTNSASPSVSVPANDATGLGALGRSLAARADATTAKTKSVSASVQAGVSYVNASGVYVAATGGAEAVAKSSEAAAATALITYNVSLNEYKNALAVPLLDSDRLNQDGLELLKTAVNNNAGFYNTAKGVANKDRSVANAAAVKASAAVASADAAELAALAAEAAAAAANRYYLQTEQDVLNAARTPVSVNMNIEIDAQNNINIFGEKPVLPTNVIEARYKLPVDALYDDAAYKGLIEFWEPDDDQGDIRVELAHSNLCGKATAALTGDGVSETFTIDNPGSGYKTAPLIMLESVNEFGSGAVAHAVLENGAIASIVLKHAGSGYTAVPRVRIISSYQKDYTDAYKYCAVKFVNGMERILCDQFDCSNANPFSDKKYKDASGNVIEQYTKQRDFGRVSLATLSHYLFGHIDATAAITNDVDFVESMLSLMTKDADTHLAVQYETDERYPTGHASANQVVGAVLRNAEFTPFSGNANVNGLMALEGSASDAMLAKRLMGAILKKGLKSDGTFMSSNVIANAATDKACLANIVRQVLGQDETRSMNKDNSQRAIDQHDLLRFYAGDVIYMNIKVKRPNVTVSPGPTNMLDASAAYVNEISFSLKITLSEKA